MSRNACARIFWLVPLVLGALNFGCGGGGMPPSSQISPSPQTDLHASQPMQAPILGFAYAAGSGELQPINGVTGAAVLSSPLALPEGVTRIDFAPGQGWAVASRPSGGTPAVISFLAANLGPLVPIPGAISEPDIIAFSPSGGAVALYSIAQERLQVVGGLPANPQLTRDLGSGDLPAAAQFLAIADDGVTLLEGAATNAVYLLAGNGPQLLASVSSLGGMAFNPQSNDALVFDRDGGTLALWQSVSTMFSSRVLANGLTGLPGTIDLATDGRRAVVTGPGANRLWAVDLGNLQVQDLPLPTPPAMLSPLRVAGDYLLSWQAGGPAWIMDTNRQKAAVYLVPAAAQTQSALVR
jgi:DNA-binding beta-propeller fold protein YncE